MIRILKFSFKPFQLSCSSFVSVHACLWSNKKRCLPSSTRITLQLCLHKSVTSCRFTTSICSCQWCNFPAQQPNPTQRGVTSWSAELRSASLWLPHILLLCLWGERMIWSPFGLKQGVNVILGKLLFDDAWMSGQLHYRNLQGLSSQAVSLFTTYQYLRQGKHCLFVAVGR